MLLDLASWILVLGGAFLVVTGALGLLRLPDFFTRLHAASLTDTMGIGLVCGGLALQAGWSQASLKLALTLVFLLFTGPVATHALAKAAVHGGECPQAGAVTQEDGPSNT